MTDCQHLHASRVHLPLVGDAWKCDECGKNFVYKLMVIVPTYPERTREAEK